MSRSHMTMNETVVWQRENGNTILRGGDEAEPYTEYEPDGRARCVQAEMPSDARPMVRLPHVGEPKPGKDRWIFPDGNYIWDQCTAEVFRQSVTETLKQAAYVLAVADALDAHTAAEQAAESRTDTLNRIKELRNELAELESSLNT